MFHKTEDLHRELPSITLDVDSKLIPHGRKGVQRLLLIEVDPDLHCVNVLPISGQLQNRSCAKRFPVLFQLGDDLGARSIQDLGCLPGVIFEGVNPLLRWGQSALWSRFLRMRPIEASLQLVVSDWM
jgi:hypothetical protein